MTFIAMKELLSHVLLYFSKDVSASSASAHLLHSTPPRRHDKMF
jgi:hypothetical protein